MLIKDLRKVNEVIDLFCGLAEIPSPSLKEEKVAKFIKNFCKNENIPCKTDAYGNVIIKIKATDNSKPSIAFSSHMDVVGDDSEIVLLENEGFIHANNRTLGADDKAGITCALNLAKYISKSDISHGGLEIVFTRDEENSMSGILNFDFKELESKYVLVLDADAMGQLQVSGASYVNGHLTVKSFLGGHSGNDIADTKRANAAKLLAELCAEIPQGVYFADDTGVITSINLGGITGGNLSVTNVINTFGEATYSIRSASVEKENELIEKINLIVKKFNEKYIDIAQAEFITKKKLFAFEKSNDTKIAEVFSKAAKSLNINYSISSFHAGAETHIYCLHENKNGEKFLPFLVGVADIYNMHSSDEKVCYKSLIKGSELVQALFIELNK